MPHSTSARALLGYGIPARSLGLFFDTLAVQLEMGRAIGDALVDASSGTDDRELQRICASVAPMISRGASLCSSLRPYAGRFPEIVMPILEVGEISGTLPGSARRLAATFQQSVSAEHSMKFNAYDPKLALLGLCIARVYAVLIAILSSPQREQPIAATAISVAVGVAIYAVEVVAVYQIGRLVLRGLYRWQALRVQIDRIKIALPMLGPISRNLSIARWARSFAVLWSAGVNIAKALEVSSRSSLNAYYERALSVAAAQTRLGRPLSQSLAGAEMLPPYLLHIIQTSETVGRMDDQLLSPAAEMEREALTRAELAMNKIVIAAQVALFLVAFIHSAL